MGKSSHTNRGEHSEKAFNYQTAERCNLSDHKKIVPGRAKSNYLSMIITGPDINES